LATHYQSKKNRKIIKNGLRGRNFKASELYAIKKTNVNKKIMKIISVRQNPEYKEKAIKYFQDLGI
jgi:hypothetical protein